MSSLIHPIHTAATKCRPKHQVLVLKCYPKYQKNVQEIKPNSSELSYLLYYASTRRSKLQKVGAFLEKKTASDVWRVRLGNVQVTLQILTGIIEKAPRDLPLYSHSVLTILDSVLRSNDINMIEESIPTFETYCKHVDPSSLAADQKLAHQYLSIVQIYAKFASDEFLSNTKVSKNPPMVVRWRIVCLKALKSAVGSDAVVANSGKQLDVVMPVILENLYLEEDDILASLQQRAQTSEKVDLETARKRRMSIATVTTVDTVDADPATASQTTADADKIARDEVRVLAMRCLRQIFAAGTSSHRGQIRLATALTIRFITSRNPPPISIVSTRPALAKSGNWATSLIEAVARWTPVQDRFIIVVTAMETLVRSPIMESILPKQLVLATMIDWLLSSSINLIGLSVMDVLIGFIQHTLLLLQLGGRKSKVAPHYQQSDGLDLFGDVKETLDPGATQRGLERGRGVVSKEATASPVRQELLLRLQKCIGDLATHIYYTDQITDMMTAILARLKPSLSAVAAIEDPSATARAIATSINLQEDSATDDFFSFATARVTALKAIKDILMIANYRRTATGTAIEARSRVGVQVWEGTQWLLRDEDREVRTAYVDALLTWLKLETNKNDLSLPKEGSRKPKVGKKDAQGTGEVKLARRAVSSASRKEPKPAKSTFLQLLHLAVYDNALESAETESDILLLHLLLTNLLERLGVNAVRSGLPMILKLQAAVLNDNAVTTPEGKVNISSLAHGYLWAIAEKFDFETSRIGNEINAEISRRKRFAIWCGKIRSPPIAIDHITPTAGDEKRQIISEDALGTLRPFLNTSDLVDEVALAYDSSLVTPPTSPSSSPGRVFSVPTLGFGYGYSGAPGSKPSPEDQLPQKVKDEMVTGWSREACMAAVERESTKSASVTGSRAGTSTGRRQLGINGALANGTNSGRESPNVAQLDTSAGGTPNHGLFAGLSSLQKLRRTSTNGGSPVPLSGSSSRDSTMRVTDLKRALLSYQNDARYASPLRRPFSHHRESTRSTSSDSVISCSEADDQEPVTESAGSANTGEKAAMVDATTSQSRPGTSASQHGQSSSTVHDRTTLTREVSDPRLGDDVPPVPKISPSLNSLGNNPRDASPLRNATPKSKTSQTVPGSISASPESQKLSASEVTTPPSIREGRSMGKGYSRPTSRRGPAPGTWNESTAAGGKLDLGKLLAGIQPTGNNMSVPEERAASMRPMSKPPY